MIDNNPFKYRGDLNPNRDLGIYTHLYNYKNTNAYKKIRMIENGIKNFKYFNIIAPVHSGKTTFIRQLINRLEKDELNTHEIIYITLENTSEVEHKFFANIAKKIIRNLSNKYTIDPSSLLNMPAKIQNNDALEFGDFLIALSKAELFNKKEDAQLIKYKKKKNIKYIIFIDDIDCISKQYIGILLRTIRAIFLQRHDIEGFYSLSFIISGAIDLERLTCGSLSPYNIAERIYLEDFEEEAITFFLENVLKKIEVEYYKNFPKEIFEATMGHPCLTQKLCGKIINELILENRDSIQKHDLPREINTLINNFDLTLATAWNKIKDDKSINILKRILGGEQIPYNEINIFFHELRLAGGIVCDERGFCKIRNPIYERFFTKQFTMYSD